MECCLVCGNEKALDKSDPSLDGSSVNCPSCGRYSISGTVLAQFLELPRKDRKDALDKAKRRAKPDSIPMIDSTTLVRGSSG